MERIKKDSEDIVNPDSLFIKRWNLNLTYHDESIAISSDGNKLYFDCSNHLRIHLCIKNENTFDLRYWRKYNIMTMWVSGNVFDELKKLRLLLNKYKLFKQIDIDSIQFIFVEQIDYEDYIVKCNINEIENDCIIVSNSDYRIFHLLVPLEKQKELLRDAKLREAKYNYYLMSQRAWIQKHGHIDPAFWHLLMYEE